MLRGSSAFPLLCFCFLTNLRCECEHAVSDDVELGGSQHSYSPVGSSRQTEPRVTTWDRGFI